MGNLESADGGPGEPPSVSLLPPPGKMPMPEPCELEERFALVLVRAEPSPFPLLPPPRSRRPGWDLAAVPPRARPFSRGCRQTPVPLWKPRAAAGRRARLARQPRQPGRGPLTAVSTTGHLGGVPSPGPSQDPDFFLPLSPLLLPFSLLPTSPTSSPGPWILIPTPLAGAGKFGSSGRATLQPKSGLSARGDCLSC